jgi:protein tyrosine phosphatase (PTP) superfamily phosphohydrolase (DUF442 family)
MERQSATEEQQIIAAVPHNVRPIHSSNAAGLSHVFRLGDSIYSGSSPEDGVAFESLKRLGVNTIISVEAYPPDAELARQHGMRYVHLPITFHGIPHEVVVGLVRASRELPGSYYVHSHHGRSRGPAAAIALWRCLDKHITAEQADATLRLIDGTRAFPGLHDSLRSIRVPTEAELAATKSDLPEATAVPPMARSMSEIDRMWDRVATPASDRNSTTIAFQLSTAYDIIEQFREAAELRDATDAMKSEFHTAIGDLEALADVIKSELRDPSTPDVAARAQAVHRVQQRCDHCHGIHRQ